MINKTPTITTNRILRAILYIIATMLMISTSFMPALATPQNIISHSYGHDSNGLSVDPYAPQVLYKQQPTAVVFNAQSVRDNDKTSRNHIIIATSLSAAFFFITIIVLCMRHRKMLCFAAPAPKQQPQAPQQPALPPA